MANRGERGQGFGLPSEQSGTIRLSGGASGRPEEGQIRAVPGWVHRERACEVETRELPWSVERSQTWCTTPQEWLHRPSPEYLPHPLSMAAKRTIPESGSWRQPYSQLSCRPRARRGNPSPRGSHPTGSAWTRASETSRSQRLSEEKSRLSAHRCARRRRSERELATRDSWKTFQLRHAPRRISAMPAAAETVRKEEVLRSMRDAG